VVQRVRARRKELNVLPVVKQIDTLAGEFPAQTNYLYFTYNGDSDDLPAEKESENKVIVLGSGSYSIGSSVEFDWCCVSAAAELRRQGYETIMVNCNPETVSTDYDMCSKLYFEELTFERVSDIYDREKPLGLVVSMGGQVPNNLAKRLGEAGMKVLGTSTDCIDRAENRHKFSALLDELGIDQPEWKELTSIEESKAFAEKAGYPVLVRPSYVLSGAAMNVAFNPKELEEYLGQAQNVSKEYPVVISKFITGAKEIEVDAVARNGGLLAWALSEHVENAGVHSGDATMVFPANKVYTETAKQAQNVAESISRALNITGPFNIQFLAKDNKLKVIECNLRASRSFPFVSKVLKENFIHTAVKAIMGKETAPVKKNQFALSYVGVKCPVFSYTRIKGADPIPGVEMASTGEVACIGANVYDAYLKS
ncbi:MAG TPA: ATP-grasp domain-containing protein, partial [archaeon]|nr:ATP-grasp domain-containing protein [archaeon]